MQFYSKIDDLSFRINSTITKETSEYGGNQEATLRSQRPNQPQVKEKCIQNDEAGTNALKCGARKEEDFFIHDKISEGY